MRQIYHLPAKPLGQIWQHIRHSLRSSPFPICQPSAKHPPDTTVFGDLQNIKHITKREPINKRASWWVYIVHMDGAAKATYSLSVFTQLLGSFAGGAKGVGVEHFGGRGFNATPKVVTSLPSADCTCKSAHPPRRPAHILCASSDLLIGSCEQSALLHC